MSSILDTQFSKHLRDTPSEGYRFSARDHNDYLRKMMCEHASIVLDGDAMKDGEFREVTCPDCGALVSYRFVMIVYYDR